MKHYVISIDSPDPDNQLMVKLFCKAFQEEIKSQTFKLHVILSPRPVDLRYRLLSDEEKIELRNIKNFNSSLPSWIDQGKQVENQLKLKYKDVIEDEKSKSLTQSIIQDSLLILVVSFLRISDFLCKEFGNEFTNLISFCSNFDISMKTIKHGLHHTVHSPDWLQVFKTNDKQYNKIVEHLYTNNYITDGSLNVSEQRRQYIGAKLQKYVNKKMSGDSKIVIDMNKIKDNMKMNFDNLLDSEKVKIQRLFIGGPMTETNFICKKNLYIGKIYIMGGSLSAGNEPNCKSNIFKNQFNFLVDMESTFELLHIASQNSRKFIFFPTESMKQWTCVSPNTYTSPYLLEYSELTSDVKNLIDGYYFKYSSGQIVPEKNNDSQIPIFDVAPILHFISETFPEYDFFNLCQLRYNYDEKTDVIKFITIHNQNDTVHYKKRIDSLQTHYIGHMAYPLVLQGGGQNKMFYPNEYENGELSMETQKLNFKTLMKEMNIYK